MKQNPFFELYVGDRITSLEFLTMFSPVLVKHATAIFRAGNIVVTGVQGSGKSMLLRLLRTEIRMQYFEHNQEFPVPAELRNFISASVNLAHSNAIDFGYRKEIDSDTLKVEFLFGDFLNYLIVDDFLGSLEAYANADSSLKTEVGIQFDAEILDKIAIEISSLPVWEGWLESCDSMAQLRARVQSRSVFYRRFLHLKDKKLDQGIENSATGVGEPMIEISRMLKTSGYIHEKTNIFIDIDQYEELGNISSRNSAGKVVDYRSVINKALSSRTPHVSYRIGTRGHSWRNHGKIHGTDGVLELERHYKYIDLDLLLKGQELERDESKVFAEFATDVFQRRLKFAEYEVDDADTTECLATVYGRKISDSEKVNRHLGLRDKPKFIRLQPSWSEETKSELLKIAEEDLFSAKLGEVWLNQKGDKVSITGRRENLPWERTGARWWRKERSSALAMQITSQSSQKMIWAGSEEILALSGGSILTFLSLNQNIWSTWLRNSGKNPDRKEAVPQIDINIQSVGIFNTSRQWLSMINQETGRSAERSRFVKHVGSYLRKKLTADKSLSYPGGNGFSITEGELDNYRDIALFLKELADYGNMSMSDHSTKSNDKKSRKKFYFNPIFCPFIGIPYIKTKEPLYVKISLIAAWMYESGYSANLTIPKNAQDTRLI